MNNFFCDITYNGDDFKTHKLPKGDYENCTFANCNFKEGFIDNINFIECTFQRCDLTNVNCTATIFNQVTFIGCKMIGIDFSPCNPMFLNLGFTNCNLTLANFNALELPKTNFKDCTLDQVDFSETQLKGSNIENCQLKNTVFYNTKLDSCNFNSSTYLLIDPDQNSIKKTKFNIDQLPGLLKKHDIVVAY